MNLNFRTADSFTLEDRYSVYADLGANARFLRLADGGAGLRTVARKFEEIARMSDTLVLYNTTFGINIMLLLFLFLKVIDFQPRLGIVTRTLSVAFQDLAHCFAILTIVFLVYAALGHITLGGQLEVFSSMESTCQSLFNFMALGYQGDTEDIFQLTGALLYPGIVYYVSYTVIMVLVMLNFLLGIVIDAFVEVKDEIKVGPGGFCSSPRHHPYFRPSFLELFCVLRDRVECTSQVDLHSSRGSTRNEGLKYG